MRACVRFVSVVLCACVCIAGATPTVPLDGDNDAQYVNLPDDFEAERAFLPPTVAKGDQLESLPKEPTEISITIARTANRILYYYMGDDVVFDVFKYVAERTGLSMTDMVSIVVVKQNVVGRTEVPFPLSYSTKLRDVPVVAGDELEVKFLDSIDVNSLVVAPNPPATVSDPLPGYFDVQAKIAGFPTITVPIPRSAEGKMVKTIMEDRCGLLHFGLELRKNTRDGAVLEKDEALTDVDKFFWGTLQMKQAEDESLFAPPPDCDTGVASVVTNLGKSDFYTYNCNTTAQDVVTFVENLGLLPEEDPSGEGVIVSVKGFFHTRNMDTLKKEDVLVESGLQKNGIIFITIPCPVTLVYFKYYDSTFPQLLNCTSTTDYMVPIFWGVSGHNEVTPKFIFTTNDNKEQEVLPGAPIAKQLSATTNKVIRVEFPRFFLTSSASPVPSPVHASRPPTPSNTPSPSPHVAWDAQDERTAPPPADAVALGDGALLQSQVNPHKLPSKEERSKYRAKRA